MNKYFAGKKTVGENKTKQINEDRVTTKVNDNTFEKRREERETIFDPSTKGRIVIWQEEKVSQSRTPFKIGDSKEAGKGCKMYIHVTTTIYRSISFIRNNRKKQTNNKYSISQLVHTSKKL